MTFTHSTMPREKVKSKEDDRESIGLHKGWIRRFRLPAPDEAAEAEQQNRCDEGFDIYA